MTTGPALPHTLGAPATRALRAAGYEDLRALRGLGRAGLLELHGVGPTAVRLLEAALDEHGWTLAPDG